MQIRWGIQGKEGECGGWIPRDEPLRFNKTKGCLVSLALIVLPKRGNVEFGIVGSQGMSPWYSTRQRVVWFPWPWLCCPREQILLIWVQPCSNYWWCSANATEVGAVLSIVLPIPVIIFDSRLESPVLTLAMALGGDCHVCRDRETATPNSLT